LSFDIQRLSTIVQRERSLEKDERASESNYNAAVSPAEMRLLWAVKIAEATRVVNQVLNK